MKARQERVQELEDAFAVPDVLAAQLVSGSYRAEDIALSGIASLPGSAEITHDELRKNSARFVVAFPQTVASAQMVSSAQTKTVVRANSGHLNFLRERSSTPSGKVLRYVLCHERAALTPNS